MIYDHQDYIISRSLIMFAEATFQVKSHSEVAGFTLTDIQNHWVPVRLETSKVFSQGRKYALAYLELIIVLLIMSTEVWKWISYYYKLIENKNQLSENMAFSGNARENLVVCGNSME